MQEFNEAEKELSRRIDELGGRCNRLELLFEHNRENNNRIVGAVQKEWSDFRTEMKVSG